MIARETKDGKGIGIFSCKEIRAGETILCEAPILVYPQASLATKVCSYCLKDLHDVKGT